MRFLQLAIYLCVFFATASSLRIARTCPNGGFPKGSCRRGRKCPTGYECTRWGFCCKATSASPCADPSFEGPSCGPSTDQPPCKEGYECKEITKGSGEGVCCLVPDVCPKGTLTGPLCDPSGYGRKMRCKQGYRCTQIPFSHLGQCCSDNSQGTCPRSSGMPGTCEFDPDTNCLGDKYCPPFHKCCREGCGRVCKRAIYGQRY